MEYEHSYRSNENHIYVEAWEGLEVANMPEYYFEMPNGSDEYVYELEVGATWDDMFGELIVRKVLAADQETMFELTEEEVEAIINVIGASDIFGAEV